MASFLKVQFQCCKCDYLSASGHVHKATCPTSSAGEPCLTATTIAVLETQGRAQEKSLFQGSDTQLRATAGVSSEAKEERGLSQTIHNLTFSYTTSFC
jgi:hypothetical protein